MTFLLILTRISQRNPYLDTQVPQNLRPIFTDEQLASSLHATTFWLPALRGSLIMDTEWLQTDIISSLQSDLTVLEHLSNKAES